jgi:lipoprotein-releasing system permease protein
LLAGASGTLALGFIILVAAGIAAMTLLFMGSAVVVLERFARVAKSWAWIGTFTVAVALGSAAIRVDVRAPELSARPWKEWLERFADEAAVCALIAVVAVLVCRLLVWRLSSARLGRVVLLLLGLIAGLFLVAAAWPELQAHLVALGVYVLWVFFAVVVFGLLPLAAAGLVEMRRSVEWFIAARYLVAKRRQVFISAITAICVGGIAAGVWLIIIVLSVMNGFEATWRNEILGNRAHFTVHNSSGPFPDYERVLEKVRSVPEVVAVSPYIDVDGMVRGRAGEIFSVRVRGIDPASVDGVTDLRSDLILGSLDALVRPATAADGPPEQDGREVGDGDPGIVIGNQLALSVGAAVGDSLLLISPFGGPPTPLGPAPRLKRFRLVGVFESSFFQYDEAYTYVSIPAAQEFRRSGPVIDGIEARTTDYYRSRRVGQAVEQVLDFAFYTRDWKEFFPAFFQALKTERVMMFMLLTMIMVVAAFLIVATLIMMIMEPPSSGSSPSRGLSSAWSEPFSASSLGLR